MEDVEGRFLFLVYIVTDVSKITVLSRILRRSSSSQILDKRTTFTDKKIMIITVELFWHYSHLIVALYLHTNKYVWALYCDMCCNNDELSPFLFCHIKFVSRIDRSKSPLYILFRNPYSEIIQKKFSHICNMDLYQYYYRLINQMIAFI